MTVLVTSSPARGIRDTGNRDPIFSDMFEAVFFYVGIVMGLVLEGFVLTEMIVCLYQLITPYSSRGRTP